VIVGIALAGCAGLDRLEPPEPGQGGAGETETDSGIPPAEEAGTICYPGPDGAFDACLDLLDEPWPPEDYVYPPPLDGSPQYAAPSAFLDVETADPFAAIAPDFLLGELADASQGGGAIVQLHALMALQAVRDRVGALIVNSGYRTPAHNAAVGGATWSRHIYGDAFDLVPLDATLDEAEGLALVADACRNEGAAYVEIYATHVHCDWRDDPLDEAFFE